MRHVLFLLVFLDFSTAQAQSGLFASRLELELDAAQSLPLAKEIIFELVSPNADSIAKELAKWNDIFVTATNESALAVTMIAQPKFSGMLRSEYTASSFVVDLDEQSTQRFVSGFIPAADQPLELPALAKYVHSYIEHPTFIHGFNIASVAAKQRSGDCTEFAVLATALARSLGIPARIVVGSVLVEEKSEVTAFGHAWAEVWSDGQWQILDAALYDSKAIQHFYLPAAELDNEGPGFAMALMKSVGLLPSRIRRLRNFAETTGINE